MTEEFDVQVKKRGGFTIAKPAGRIGLGEAEVFADALSPLVQQDLPFLVIDLSEVDFIGSRGIGLLMQARSEAMRRKGRVILAHPSATLMQILRVSHLDSTFDIVSDMEALISRSQELTGQVDHLI